MSSAKIPSAEVPYAKFPNDTIADTQSSKTSDYRNLFAETVQISVSSVRVGDVLAIRGDHPVSRGIGDIDDCYTDHVVIVSAVENDTIVFAEQNFDGFRFTDFSGYDDEVEVVIVRRHVCDGATEFVPPLLAAFAELKPVYSYDRLLDMVLLGIVKYASVMNGYTSEQEQAFADRMNLLFLMGAETIKDPNARLCVDPILSVYSRAANYMASQGRPTPMDWSIVLPTRNCGSLNLWRAAVQQFLELLHRNSRPSIDPIGSLIHLLEQASVEGGKGSVRSEARGTPVKATAQATATAMATAGGLDAVVRAVDDYLLDRLLTRRFLATPRDLVLSPSLVTVGRLDPSAFAESGRNQ